MSRLLRSFLAHIVQRGTLEVEPPRGPRFVVGDGTGNVVAIRIVDEAAVHFLLLNPSLALGELFTEGRLVVTQGTIYELIALVASNLKFGEPSAIAHLLTQVRTLARALMQWNTLRSSKRNVDRHYNLDSRLFDLFLDIDRQYSCAYFEHEGQSLDDAQLAKKRHIAAKLLIEPGHRVLDIGCGWGGLALYLARQCQARVTGITLSSEQLAIAEARLHDHPPGTQAEFRLQDYREVEGRFQRIVSVGMFEHVGVSYYSTFFDKIATLLTDDGVMLLHSIGRSDGPGATNPWIAKYIFPGGYFPALSEVLPVIERSGLFVTDIEILRLHYAETLRAWRHRFLARRDEAKAIYDERFCRLWEFYLSAAECAFRYSGLMVFQIQVARRQDAPPLTRDYIAQREAELRKKELQIERQWTAAE